MAYNDNTRDDIPIYGQDPNQYTARPVPDPTRPPDPNRQSRFDEFWKRIPQGASWDDIVNQGYQFFLGREADPEGFESHRGNPGGTSAIIETLYDSPEALAYRTQQAAGAGTGTTPPAGSTGGTYPGGLPSRGNVGQLTGYPDEQLGRSMKHVFGSIASRYANDRNQLARILEDPEFKQWFPNARQVGDDRIDFGGQLSDFDSGVPVYTVDVSRGGDDAWQWIDEAYMNDGGGGGGGAGGGTGNTLPDGSYNTSGFLDRLMEMISGLGGGGSDPGTGDITQKILEELQQQSRGTGSPLQRQALLQQMERLTPRR